MVEISINITIKFELGRAQPQFLNFFYPHIYRLEILYKNIAASFFYYFPTDTILLSDNLKGRGRKQEAGRG
jgi:hypothetical protein